MIKIFSFFFFCIIIKGKRLEENIVFQKNWESSSCKLIIRKLKKIYDDMQLNVLKQKKIFLKTVKKSKIVMNNIKFITI